MAELIVKATDYHDIAQFEFVAQLIHRMLIQPENILFTLIFIFAIIHIFISPFFIFHSGHVGQTWHVSGIPYIQKEKKLTDIHYSFKQEMLYFFGEIELVFGFWAIPLLLLIAYAFSTQTMLSYVNDWDYSEALYIFSSLAVAATRPIINLGERLCGFFVRFLGDTTAAWWFVLLVLPPLLGSFVKESVAIVVAAKLLASHFYRAKPSYLFSVVTIALLFVNSSLGSSLTAIASPALILVAPVWGWNSWTAFTHFGIISLISIIVATLGIGALFFKELKTLKVDPEPIEKVPLWIMLVHLFFLGWIIANANQPVILIGSLVIFLGFVQATSPYQYHDNVKQSLFVGFFIASLILHIGLQAWWAESVLENLGDHGVFWFGYLSSGFAPNPSLAFLGTQVPHMTEMMRVNFFQGILAGGGLTLIGNTHNIVGYAILYPWLEGKKTLPLFITLFALPISSISAILFWFLW